MPSRQFLSKQEEQQIVEAINTAEQKTSGEVRIHLEHHCEGDALDRADKVFHDLGMDETKLQNGVLIYVATEDHKAAVYAGKGIHREVEEGFWDDVLQILISHFKQEEYEQGIEEAVHKVGNKLEELFPYHQKGDLDELSNEISFRDNKN
ncbi:MAG: TPM domain-containing protein [Aliifodinibius sp.]|nr:TPM domain-containing protein [Fodinibius sp.]NIY29061.1 TPM domain-containing protein [Fodinibius sp.]